jgi:hypothetical protein
MSELARMKANMTRVLGLALLLLSLVMARPALATAQVSEVRDLHYGTVLYEFYQQNYFSAAVNLLTAQQQQRLEHHDAEGQVLLGGLYLSYGLHTEAEQIFQKLIDENAEPAVRDRAWFYLGKIRYHKQLFREAGDALSRVGDALDESLQEEFRNLKANLLMAQKRYTEAVQSLTDISQRKGDAAAHYARFNLGVALVRAGREKEGVDLLREVGRLQTTEADLKALRDKANLALGYMLIKSSPIIAKDFLSRVRLNGPFSNRALLGLGWAEAELQRYQQALVPWMELAKRDRVDIAVFEAQLAIGNVLERLRAYPQAMQAYDNAIKLYEQELTSLENTQAAVKAGRLWEDLLAQVSQQGSQNQMGWFWEAELLPDTPEARYLPTLMAGHGFHEAIKNLRDLRFLQDKLNRWEQEMPAFDHMLALRRDTYAAQLDRLTPEQTLDRVVDVRTSRDFLADELKRIKAAGDAMALATEKEQKLLDRLQKMEERIWRLSSERKVDRYRDRYRFYKGLLEYDIHTTFAIRHRQVEKSLKALNAELDATLAQQDSLQNARAQAPKRFEGFQARIDNQRQRISDAEARVNAAFSEQQQQLQLMVDAELDQLHARLIDYLDQARFSLAHLQDLATSAVDTQGEAQ